MSGDGYGKSPISVGPWGGPDGARWDDGVYSTVRQLVIAHGAGINSIQIEYDMKGNSLWSEKHGGSGGVKTDKVKLDFPDEFLTSIHGYYGNINEWDPTYILSLSFESNQKKFGPFGVEQGTHFSFPMTGGKIVGFHGRSYWCLDSIGVHLKPLYNSNPSKSMIPLQSAVASRSENFGYNVVQGSIGKGYDIVLAVRQKDDNSKVPSNYLSRQTSSNSYSESKDKLISKASIQLLGYPSDPDIGSLSVEGPVTYGPWGGNGGSTFDDGINTGVRQIHLSRSAGVNSIKVLYDQSGQAVWGSKNGRSGGLKYDKIIFDYPSEILTHITGYYGPTMIMGPNVIKSLTFHTTKKKYGPFGDEQGTSFSSNLKEGMIVGFHGRKGWFIDSIGVHVLEGKLSLPQLSPTNSINASKDMPITEVQWSNKLVLAKRIPSEEVVSGVIKEPAPCGAGPWGGDGGRPWDDGVFSGIKQIYVTRGEAICSIQIEYDRNGQSLWSVKHGGSSVNTSNKITFEYPNEVLTCISGYYGPVSRDERSIVIRSLTFYTSRGKYGPYGDEIGTFFTSTTTEGKVVGFHGRSSSYLDAIGIHMQHWLGDRRSGKSSFLKIFDILLIEIIRLTENKLQPCTNYSE
ncbi:hypothetical protein HHK36_010197 [Tetracentron sinense]|uniref:Jacalin-type lectin domain-containing protein n=1 Tax=Tetracentron sinense TaxID=13715 RepID=A0A834ZH41_TETSI|nr:hypothetical protein HHK36_010197 [Tetracentron sinense]